MTDFRQGYLMGLLAGATLAIVIPQLLPHLQSLWSRLHQRRDVLDPPQGIYVVHSTGERQRVFAQYRGRKGWRPRIWMVQLPAETVQAFERREARMHVDKLPGRTALVFGGHLHAEDDRPGPMV